MDPSRIYKFFQNKTKQYFWRRKHTCTKYSMLHVPRGKRTFRVLDGSVQTSGLFIRDLHPDFSKAFWVKWNRIKIKLTINGSFKMSFFFFMLYCFFTTTELAFTPKRVSPRLPDVCLFIYIQSHVSGGVLCSNAWLTLSNRGCVRSVNPPPPPQPPPPHAHRCNQFETPCCQSYTTQWDPLFHSGVYTSWDQFISFDLAHDVKGIL